MKKILIHIQKAVAIFMMVLVASQAQAQLSAYNFSSQNSTYNEITNGTVLGNTFNNDHVFIDPSGLDGIVPINNNAVISGPGFPIGFDFVMQGRIYNRLAISTNGWVSLGRNGARIFSAFPTPIGYVAMDTIPALLGFFNNLRGKPTGGSSLRIITVGNPGSRVCVIQWKNYDLTNSYVLPGDNYNFQIQLHESGNTVIYHYGSISTIYETVFDPFTMMVGIKGFSRQRIHLRTGNWVNSGFYSGIDVTNSGQMNMSATNKPTNGQRFDFTPSSIPLVCDQRPVASFFILTGTAGAYTFVNNSSRADYYIWNFGANATPANLTTYSKSEVSVSYSTSASKTISLTAIKADCIDSVFVRRLNATSSKTALSQAQVSTYPNPVSKQLFIENNTSKLLGLQIVDIVGHQVMDKLEVSNNSKFVLNIDGLSPGVYILYLRTSEGVRIEKILVY